MQYNVITLDPPWPYDRTAGQGVANKQYSLMTWDGLAALGPLLHALAAPNCAIFVWTTAPLLMEQTDIVKAWGFRYITKAFCWVKTNRNGIVFHGVGSYTASNTEDVWLLSNGTPKRQAADVSQVVPTLEDHFGMRGEAVVAPMGRHSKKPEEIQDRIERLCSGPYLEVFSRRRRPNWTCLGNELDGLDIRESLARVAADDALPVYTPRSIEQRSFMDAA
jgi:N6-adenosine-specific RNA methylase IME4